MLYNSSHTEAIYPLFSVTPGEKQQPLSSIMLTIGLVIDCNVPWRGKDKDIRASE